VSLRNFCFCAKAWAGRLAHRRSGARLPPYDLRLRFAIKLESYSPWVRRTRTLYLGHHYDLFWFSASIWLQRNREANLWCRPISPPLGDTRICGIQRLLFKTWAVLNAPKPEAKNQLAVLPPAIPHIFSFTSPFLVFLFSCNIPLTVSSYPSKPHHIPPYPPHLYNPTVHLIPPSLAPPLSTSPNLLIDLTPPSPAHPHRYPLPPTSSTSFFPNYPSHPPPPRLIHLHPSPRLLTHIPPSPLLPPVSFRHQLTLSSQLAQKPRGPKKITWRLQELDPGPGCARVSGVFRLPWLTRLRKEGMWKIIKPNKGLEIPT